MSVGCLFSGDCLWSLVSASVNTIRDMRDRIDVVVNINPPLYTRGVLTTNHCESTVWCVTVRSGAQLQDRDAFMSSMNAVSNSCYDDEVNYIDHRYHIRKTFAQATCLPFSRRIFVFVVNVLSVFIHCLHIASLSCRQVSLITIWSKKSFFTIS